MFNITFVFESSGKIYQTLYPLPAPPTFLHLQKSFLLEEGKDWIKEEGCPTGQQWCGRAGGGPLLLTVWLPLQFSGEIPSPTLVAEHSSPMQWFSGCRRL